MGIEDSVDDRRLSLPVKLERDGGTHGDGMEIIAVGIEGDGVVDNDAMGDEPLLAARVEELLGEEPYADGQ